jgi:putative FmdB family regulatory protein
MPIYEFRCPNGHEFEHFYRTISGAASEQPCPECGAIATRKLSAGAGLVFKGSGFYLTDYGKNAHRKAEPGKKGEGAPAEGGGAKTESGKSEAKAEGTKSDAGKSEGPKSNSDASQSKPPKPKSE